MVRLPCASRRWRGKLDTPSRSLGGAISADLCTAKIPLSGLIYLSSLPHIGDILALIGTPLAFSFVPGLTSPEGWRAPVRSSAC
jgi:hypothetical protein